VPAITSDLALSGAAVGALFAATTLAVLASAMPAAQLAARSGSRLLLSVAAVLTPVGLMLMAVAPSLGFLFAGRVVFGIGFAGFWSIGPAIAAARVTGTRGTAIVLAASGVGWLVGPAVSGALAATWGWRVPLAAVALGLAPTVLPLVREAGGGRVARPVPLRESIVILSTSRRAGWAAVISALLGVATGAIGVLVPTVLSANGVSAAGIGAAIAASSAVWVLAASASGRIRRRVDVRLAAFAVAALALAWALPSASLSSAAVVGFLLVAAASRALLGTLLYPLAVAATDGEAGAAALSGLVNVAWAVPALVMPVLVGVALEQGAARIVPAAVCLLAALVAGGMLSSTWRAAPA
jgi:predicted MFS family arabinose efflux permease